MACSQDKNSVWICDDMTDIWELKKTLDTSCFDSPTMIEDIYDVDCSGGTTEVEVNQGGERFWAKVVECPDCEYIIGEIVTDLILDHPYSKGDKIKIEVRNVYNVRRIS